MGMAMPLISRRYILGTVAAVVAIIAGYLGFLSKDERAPTAETTNTGYGTPTENKNASDMETLTQTQRRQSDVESSPVGYGVQPYEGNE